MIYTIIAVFQYIYTACTVTAHVHNYTVLVKIGDTLNLDRDWKLNGKIIPD